MKSAIFGGSFNPIHRGHLGLAREVTKLGYDCVIFVPAKQPPHKTMAGGARPDDRLKMLELALADIPWALVWEGELRRSGPSYTIDTVDELKAAGLVEERPGLIIGDDLVDGFSTWREVDRLASSTTILLGRRHPDAAPNFPYPHQDLRNPLWPHSSTAVRELIARGESLEELVPEEVAAYIRDMRLYGIH